MPAVSESGQTGRTLAVGVDLVDVGRVRDALARFPDRFVAKVLSPGERDYCLSRADPAPHVAARFAAKEAVIKCLGGGCALNEIEVVRALSGSPSITLHGRAKARARGKAVLISLSHLDNLATAFATLVEAPETQTVADAIQSVQFDLEFAGIPAQDAHTEARILVMHATNRTAEMLRMHPDALLSEKESATLAGISARRAKREPLAYILGTRGFHGVSLRVTPAVLIPRPETEFVVDAVLRHIANRATARVVDVGTGSGAIGLAVAVAQMGATVWATDVSYPAVELARENAANYGVKNRFHVAHGDLLAPVAGEAPFDVIASNPPYIAPEEIATLETEVRDWEPVVALGVHADALHFYRRLAAEAPTLLVPGGLLVVEVGKGQAPAVATLWREAGLTDIRVMPDYAGIERVVSGCRPSQR